MSSTSSPRRSRTTRNAAGWRTRLPEALASGASEIRHLISAATGRLARAGCETPRLDAEILLAGALGVGRARLVLDAREPLEDPTAVERFEATVKRRERREPVAYITGHRGFRHLDLYVDRRVLIPRPETELLVEAALSLPKRVRVVDVGTGSGAVALALKHERPDLEVIGTDVSEAALAVARQNADALGLEVKLVRGDLLGGLSGCVDAVLANLPYVADGDPLPPEISEYEPASALFAGADGLDAIFALIASLPQELPFVALEVGAGQSDAVAGRLRDADFTAVGRLPDLGGHERVVVGRR